MPIAVTFVSHWSLQGSASDRLSATVDVASLVLGCWDGERKGGSGKGEMEQSYGASVVGGLNGYRVRAGAWWKQSVVMEEGGCACGRGVQENKRV